MGIQIFPEIEAASGGVNFELIASASMVNVSTVAFTGIDAKYRILKVVWNVTNTAGRSNRIEMQLNSSNSGYVSSTETLNNATWQANVLTSGFQGKGVDATTEGGVIYVFDTNKAVSKTALGAAGGGTNIIGQMTSGIWANTATVTRIDLYSTNNTWLTGNAYLLGSE